MRVLAPIVAALVVGVCASSARADRAFAPGSAITAVDTAAGSIAAGIAWSPRACEGVVLWDPPAFTRYTFRVPGPCPQTSTGRGIAAVSVLPSRALFLSYVGGNSREWRLWTATPTARRPRLLRTATADADQPSPITVGNGGRWGAPYAVGRDVVVLGANGSRVLTWRAPAAVVALADSNAMVAVALANGDVVSLQEQTGKQLARASFPAGTVREVRPITGGLVVQADGGVTLRRGAIVRDLDIPAGARMVGYVDGWLAYVLSGEIRAYSWQKRQDVLIRDVGGTVLADDDANGLTWATRGTLCWSTRAYVSSGTHPVAGGCGR
jgi:hypothetical protein